MSRPAGLTSRDVAERIASGQSNRQDLSTSRSVWAIVKANVLTFFNGIVVTGFTVFLLLGRWQDALFGLTALANGVIGVSQELHAKRTLDRLRIVSAPTARAVRDGEEHDIRPADIVLDDVLLVRTGDQVAVDAEILSADRLTLDESLLTGEAEPVVRGAGELVKSGSTVAGGSAYVRATAVGDDATASRLASVSRRFSLVRSELRDSLNRLLRWVAWAILPLTLLVFNAQLHVQGGWTAALDSGRWTTALADTVAAVIAMIPLGLVLMTSVAFAVGALRLAREHVLVQELPAVEGLARVDALCIDKTGTLTDGHFELAVLSPLRDSSDVGEDAWRAALGWFAADRAANPTVRSLAGAFPDAGVDASATIGFSSERKWSAATLTGAASGTWVLGAPELIASLPEFMVSSTEDGHESAAETVVRSAGVLAEQGLRPLLLAHSPRTLSGAEADGERPPAGLRAVVVLALRERLRSDAARTLAYFRDQGVDIWVLSGDHPQTAAAVTRQAGMDAPKGFDARGLPDEPSEIAQALLTHRVLGRVTPEQKRDIVLALQAAGRTVAMTGDGVNDILALKVADLGIAMGSGAAATRAVARIVLLDDLFAHVPEVVAQGRQIMANIERVAVLFLAKTAYSMVLSILLGILLVETPFLSRQLSVTDGLTIGIPAFALALLPDRRRYEPGFLRRAVGFALPNGVVVAACLAALALVGDAQGLPIAQVRTVATVALTVLGLWVLVCQARPLTRWRLSVAAVMVAAAAALFAIPLATAFLEFATPPAWYGTLGAGTAALGIGVLEVVYRARRPHRGAPEAT